MEKLRHLGFFQEAERETQTALQIHSHFSRVRLADIDVPCTNYSCRSLHSLRAKAGTVTWEVVSKLRFWIQLFPLTSLACIVFGIKNNWKQCDVSTADVVETLQLSNKHFCWWQLPCALLAPRSRAGRGHPLLSVENKSLWAWVTHRLTCYFSGTNATR